MTIYEVKRIHEAKDHDYYFSRSAMKFFHQTFKDFRVTKIEDDLYFISAPMRDSYGHRVGWSERNFIPSTGKLDMIKG